MSNPAVFFTRPKRGEDMAEIDSLEIKIQSDAENAGRKLDI